MSRSTKIVRFTFWTNNLIYLALLSTFILGLQHPYGPTWSGFISLFVLIMIMLFQATYMKRKLGVTSTKDIFYFVDDEREKEMSYRVNSDLIKFYTGSNYLLLMIIAALGNLYVMKNVRLYASILISLIIVVVISANVRYYLTWNKLAKE